MSPRDYSNFKDARGKLNQSSNRFHVNRFKKETTLYFFKIKGLKKDSGIKLGGLLFSGSNTGGMGVCNMIVAPSFIAIKGQERMAKCDGCHGRR